MNCCAPSYGATARHFTATVAENDRKEYRKHGLDKRGRRFVEALTRFDVNDSSIIDIGSGIGAISVELLKRGAATATLCDAAPAYLTVARDQATELGFADRMQFVEGDFVDRSAGLPQADVVVMDR